MIRLRTRTNELLQQFADVMRGLKEEGILRSSNNPVADLGEVVACEYFDLERASANTKGYDARDRRDRRYEIKSRRITKSKGSLRLGALHNLKARPFDFLVFVVFNEDFFLQLIGKAPIEAVIRHSKYYRHTNSHRLNLTRAFLFDRAVWRKGRDDAKREVAMK